MIRLKPMSGQMVRWLAIFVLLGLAGSYLIDFLNPNLPRTLALVIGLVKIAALLSAIVVFSAGKCVCTDARSAYSRTHQLMVANLLIALIYLQIGGKLGLWMPDLPKMIELLTVFTLVSMALPAMLLAFGINSGQSTD